MLFTTRRGRSRDKAVGWTPLTAVVLGAVCLGRDVPARHIRAAGDTHDCGRGGREVATRMRRLYLNYSLASGGWSMMYPLSFSWNIFMLMDFLKIVQKYTATGCAKITCNIRGEDGWGNKRDK